MVGFLESKGQPTIFAQFMPLQLHKQANMINIKGWDYHSTKVI
jgi:hypothetical protein